MKRRLQNLFFGAPCGRLTFTLISLASLVLPASALAQSAGSAEAEKTSEADSTGEAVEAEDPGSANDTTELADKIIFQLEGGLDLMFTDFNETDGEVLFPEGNIVGLSEFDADEVIRDQTTFMFGAIKLGTKKLGLATLNTYANASFGLDLDGAPNPQDQDGIFVPEELSPIEDSTEHRFTSMAQGDFGLFLHQAYGEMEGFSDCENCAAKQFSLRAGRQSHWGLGSIIFDGATLGFESNDQKFNLAIRGGQRAGVYEKTQKDPGLYGGLTMALALDSLMIRAEYALFSRTIELSERDIERRGIEEEEFTLNMAEVATYFDATDDILISLKLQLTDTNLSHIRTGLNWMFSQQFGMILDTDLKLFDGIPYDMTGGRGIKVVDQRTGFQRTATHEVLRLNIPDTQPYVDVDAQFPLQLSKSLEIVPKAGLHLIIVDGEGAESLSPFDANYFEFGVGAFVHSRISKNAILEGQLVYDGTVYQRNNNLVGAGLISDPRAGPENQSHRIFLGARYDRGTALNRRYVQLAKRTLSVGLGGYVHINALEFRPFIENVFVDLNVDRGDPDELGDEINGLNEAEADFETEVMFGTQFFIKWWATDLTAIQLTHEFAQDSEVFYSHMAPFQSLKVTADVTF